VVRLVYGLTDRETREKESDEQSVGMPTTVTATETRKFVQFR